MRYQPTDEDMEEAAAQQFRELNPVVVTDDELDALLDSRSQVPEPAPEEVISSPRDHFEQRLALARTGRLWVGS